MALIISNNLVVSQQQETGKAGLIGYQNLLNVNNVTASSELATNPITNVANPATAYTWESAIADYAGATSYTGTNLMSSPFDPSGWTGATDPDLSYQSVTEQNPSGESFVGEFEYIGSSFANIAAELNNSFVSGETVYLSILAKPVNSNNLGFRFRFQDGAVILGEAFVNSTTGGNTTDNALVNTTFLSNGYILIEVKYKLISDVSDFDTFMQFYKVDSAGNSLAFPDIGDKIKCQAAYFGLSGRYQGSVRYSGANLMPSPFDPSGWSGVLDSDGTITSVTVQNPSGAPNAGIAEQVTSNQFNLNNGSTAGPASVGEKVYLCILCKPVGAYDSAIRFRFADDQGFIADTVLSGSTGQRVSGGTLNTNVSQLGGGFLLLEVEVSINRTDPNTYGQLILWSNDGSGVAPIGSQLYVQAAYFGKNTSFPAVIDPADPNQWPANIDESGIKIDISTAGQTIDYLGIARHNLNQAGLSVSLKFDGITVLQNQAVSDIQAVMLLVNEASPDNVQLIINGATNAPQIGVIYIGKALQLERNIYVGHTPVTYGRNRKTVNGVSENGQYLGEIVVRQNNSTSVNLQNLTPDWYRSFLDPFFKLTPRVPCFWAWRPQDYPAEVGYCWIEGEPSMSNQRSNGMVECSWNFKGIA